MNVLNRWPQKLVALLLAVLAWFVIEQTSRSTTQRSFEVPVAIVGAENETVSGVPATVTVDISGESDFVNRLSADNFEALLDITGVSGAYEQRINVVLPQGVRLVGVDPVTVAGTVETLSSKVVPVDVAVLGAMPEDALLEASVSPVEVTVRGRSSTLENVTKVVAVVGQESGAVPIYPADASNRPVPGPATEPSAVTVNLEPTPIWFSKRLELSIVPPELDKSNLVVTEFEPSASSIEIVGSKEALRELDLVVASVELQTTEAAPGEYTLAVTPQLPEGVFARETVNVTFSLAEALDDSEDTASDEALRGDDDSTDTPVRRPSATQEGEPAN